MENVQIALLGLGTVGTGVYKVLKAQKWQKAAQMTLYSTVH